MGLWGEMKPLLRDRLFPGRVASTKKWHSSSTALFQLATGYWVSQAIYVAAKLGIADLLKNGPQSYSRGALYDIPQNPIYLGEIHHRGQGYPGEHQAIVSRDLWDQTQAELKSAHQGRRNGLKARSPSLLVGLLQDGEGKRFIPSHTLKNGKRYRYYVCQIPIDGCEAPIKPTRLPAHDVELGVCRRLQSFLKSSMDVMDKLCLPEDPPALTPQLVSAAMTQSDQLRCASPLAVGDFVRNVVRRVVVHPDRIEVEASKSALHAALVGVSVISCRAATGQGKQATDDVIRLEIEARVKRCGGETRLIVPPNAPSQVEAQPVASLLKALARGRQSYEWFVTSEVSRQKSIAQKLGLSERYVGRVLECAFLAPDIVEAILEGRQPSNLTFERLTRRLPVNWIDQRRQLGFPTLHQVHRD
jgi:site-specific DNA recombinase